MEFVLGRSGDGITDRWETAWNASAFLDAEFECDQRDLTTLQTAQCGNERKADSLACAIKRNTVSVEVLDREVERLTRKLKMRLWLRRPWLLLRREKAIQSSAGMITITY